MPAAAAGANSAPSGSSMCAGMFPACPNDWIPCDELRKAYRMTEQEQDGQDKRTEGRAGGQTGRRKRAKRGVQYRGTSEPLHHDGCDEEGSTNAHFQSRGVELGVCAVHSSKSWRSGRHTRAVCSLN